jgi:hypothetical protein
MTKTRDPVPANASPQPARLPVERTTIATTGDPRQMLSDLEHKHAASSLHVTHGVLPPDESRGTDDSAAARLIATSLRAAQHDIDELPVKGAPPERERVRVDSATNHMMRAISLLERMPAPPAAVTVAGGHLEVSWLAFLHRLVETDHSEAEYDVMKEAHRQLFSALPDEAFKQPSKGYKRQTRADAEYVRDALPDALALVASDATQLLSILEATTPQNRMETLVKHEGRLLDSSAQLEWIARRIPAKEHAKFHAAANLAADRVLDVRMWLHDHPGSAQEDQRFEAVVAHMNAVLAHQGLPLVDKRRHAARADHKIASKEEAAQRDRLVKDVERGVARLADLQKAGIKRFEGLVAIDDPDPPDFVADLAKAILVASLGHLAGSLVSRAVAAAARGVVGGAAKELGNEAAKEVGARAAERVMESKLADVVTDTTQTIAGNAVQAGSAQAADKANALRRAAIFFVEGRNLAVTEFVSAFNGRLAKQIGNNELSVVSLERELAIVDQLTHAPVTDEYYVESTKAWSLYLAQSHFGIDASRGLDNRQRAVSDMIGMFGATPETNKTQGSGVFHATFTITDDPHTMHPPGIQLDSAGIFDLNNELTRTIVDDAEGILDRIYLPKEIRVRFVDTSEWGDRGTREDAIGNRSGVELLAVDERGEVRDHTGWQLLRPPRGLGKPYRDPKDFWASIRKTTLNKFWQIKHLTRGKR